MSSSASASSSSASSSALLETLREERNRAILLEHSDDMPSISTRWKALGIVGSLFDCAFLLVRVPLSPRTSSPNEAQARRLLAALKLRSYTGDDTDVSLYVLHVHSMRLSGENATLFIPLSGPLHGGSSSSKPPVRGESRVAEEVHIEPVSFVPTSYLHLPDGFQLPTDCNDLHLFALFSRPGRQGLHLGFVYSRARTPPLLPVRIPQESAQRDVQRDVQVLALPTEAQYFLDRALIRNAHAPLTLELRVNEEEDVDFRVDFVQEGDAAEGSLLTVDGNPRYPSAAAPVEEEEEGEEKEADVISRGRRTMSMDSKPFHPTPLTGTLQDYVEVRDTGTYRGHGLFFTADLKKGTVLGPHREYSFVIVSRIILDQMNRLVTESTHSHGLQVFYAQWSGLPTGHTGKVSDRSCGVLLAGEPHESSQRKKYLDLPLFLSDGSARMFREVPVYETREQFYELRSYGMHPLAPRGRTASASPLTMFDPPRKTPAAPAIQGRFPALPTNDTAARSALDARLQRMGILGYMNDESIPNVSVDGRKLRLLEDVKAGDEATSHYDVLYWVSLFGWIYMNDRTVPMNVVNCLRLMFAAPVEAVLGKMREEKQWIGHPVPPDRETLLESARSFNRRLRDDSVVFASAQLLAARPKKSVADESLNMRNTPTFTVKQDLEEKRVRLIHSLTSSGSPLLDATSRGIREYRDPTAFDGRSPAVLALEDLAALGQSERVQPPVDTQPPWNIPHTFLQLKFLHGAPSAEHGKEGHTRVYAGAVAQASGQCRLLFGMVHQDSKIEWAFRSQTPAYSFPAHAFVDFDFFLLSEPQASFPSACFLVRTQADTITVLTLPQTAAPALSLPSTQLADFFASSSSGDHYIPTAANSLRDMSQHANGVLLNPHRTAIADDAMHKRCPDPPLFAPFLETIDRARFGMYQSLRLSRVVASRVSAEDSSEELAEPSFFYAVDYHHAVWSAARWQPSLVTFSESPTAQRVPEHRFVAPHEKRGESLLPERILVPSFTADGRVLRFYRVAITDACAMVFATADVSVDAPRPSRPSSPPSRSPPRSASSRPPDSLHLIFLLHNHTRVEGSTNSPSVAFLWAPSLVCRRLPFSSHVVSVCTPSSGQFLFFTEDHTLHRVTITGLPGEIFRWFLRVPPRLGAAASLPPRDNVTVLQFSGYHTGTVRTLATASAWAPAVSVAGRQGGKTHAFLRRLNHDMARCTPLTSHRGWTPNAQSPEGWVFDPNQVEWLEPRVSAPVTASTFLPMCRLLWPEDFPFAFAALQLSFATDDHVWVLPTHMQEFWAVHADVAFLERLLTGYFRTVPVRHAHNTQTPTRITSLAVHMQLPIGFAELTFLEKDPWGYAQLQSSGDAAGDMRARILSGVLELNRKAGVEASGKTALPRIDEWIGAAAQRYLVHTPLEDKRARHVHRRFVKVYFGLSPRVPETAWTTVAQSRRDTRVLGRLVPFLSEANCRGLHMMLTRRVHEAQSEADDRAWVAKQVAPSQTARLREWQAWQDWQQQQRQRQTQQQQQQEELPLDHVQYIVPHELPGERRVEFYTFDLMDGIVSLPVFTHLPQWTVGSRRGPNDAKGADLVYRLPRLGGTLSSSAHITSQRFCPPLSYPVADRYNNWPERTARPTAVMRGRKTLAAAQRSQSYLYAPSRVESGVKKGGLSAIAPGLLDDYLIRGVSPYEEDPGYVTRAFPVRPRTSVLELCLLRYGLSIWLYVVTCIHAVVLNSPDFAARVDSVRANEAACLCFLARMRHKLERLQFRLGHSGVLQCIHSKLGQRPCTLHPGRPVEGGNASSITGGHSPNDLFLLHLAQGHLGELTPQESSYLIARGHDMTRRFLDVIAQLLTLSSHSAPGLAFWKASLFVRGYSAAVGENVLNLRKPASTGVSKKVIQHKPPKSQHFRLLGRILFINRNLRLFIDPERPWVHSIPACGFGMVYYVGLACDVVWARRVERIGASKASRDTGNGTPAASTTRTSPSAVKKASERTLTTESKDSDEESEGTESDEEREEASKPAGVTISPQGPAVPSRFGLEMCLDLLKDMISECPAGYSPVQTTLQSLLSELVRPIAHAIPQAPPLVPPPATATTSPKGSPPAQPPQTVDTLIKRLSSPEGQASMAFGIRDTISLLSTHGHARAYRSPLRQEASWMPSQWDDYHMQRGTLSLEQIDEWMFALLLLFFLQSGRDDWPDVVFADTFLSFFVWGTGVLDASAPLNRVDLAWYDYLLPRIRWMKWQICSDRFQAPHRLTDSDLEDIDVIMRVRTRRARVDPLSQTLIRVQDSFRRADELSHELGISMHDSFMQLSKQQSGVVHNPQLCSPLLYSLAREISDHANGRVQVPSAEIEQALLYRNVETTAEEGGGSGAAGASASGGASGTTTASTATGSTSRAGTRETASSTAAAAAVVVPKMALQRVRELHPVQRGWLRHAMAMYREIDLWQSTFGHERTMKNVHWHAALNDEHGRFRHPPPMDTCNMATSVDNCMQFLVRFDWQALGGFVNENTGEAAALGSILDGHAYGYMPVLPALPALRTPPTGIASRDEFDALALGLGHRYVTRGRSGARSNGVGNPFAGTGLLHTEYSVPTADTRAAMDATHGKWKRTPAGDVFELDVTSGSEDLLPLAEVVDDTATASSPTASSSSSGGSSASRARGKRARGERRGSSTGAPSSKKGTKLSDWNTFDPASWTCVRELWVLPLVLGMFFPSRTRMDSHGHARTLSPRFTEYCMRKLDILRGLWDVNGGIGYRMAALQVQYIPEVDATFWTALGEQREKEIVVASGVVRTAVPSVAGTASASKTDTAQLSLPVPKEGSDLGFLRLELPFDLGMSANSPAVASVENSPMEEEDL